MGRQRAAQRLARRGRHRPLLAFGPFPRRDRGGADAADAGRRSHRLPPARRRPERDLRGDAGPALVPRPAGKRRGGAGPLLCLCRLRRDGGLRRDRCPGRAVHRVSPPDRRHFRHADRLCRLEHRHRGDLRPRPGRGGLGDPVAHRACLHHLSGAAGIRRADAGRWRGRPGRCRSPVAAPAAGRHRADRRLHLRAVPGHGAGGTDRRGRRVRDPRGSHDPDGESLPRGTARGDGATTTACRRRDRPDARDPLAARSHLAQRGADRAAQRRPTPCPR